jgi:hypothetical protein
MVMSQAKRESVSGRLDVGGIIKLETKIFPTLAGKQ